MKYIILGITLLTIRPTFGQTQAVQNVTIIVPRFTTATSSVAPDSSAAMIRIHSNKLPERVIVSTRSPKTGNVVDLQPLDEGWLRVQREIYRRFTGLVGYGAGFRLAPAKYHLITVTD